MHEFIESDEFYELLAIGIFLIFVLSVHSVRNILLNTPPITSGHFKASSITIASSPVSE